MWQEQAACVGVDPRMFDPPAGHEDATERIDRAINICASCPVRSECLIDARTQRDDGVRGGLLLASGAIHPHLGPVDEVKVERAIRTGGHWRASGLNRAEREHLAQYLRGQGVGLGAISQRMGIEINALRALLGESGRVDRRLAPCGTPSAYQRHLTRKEPSCEPCKSAYAAWVKARRARKRAAA